MSDKETINVLHLAESEVHALRGEIARLRPLADAYRSIEAILGLLPRESSGASVDVAWLICRRIAELQPADAATAAAEV